MLQLRAKRIGLCEIMWGYNFKKTDAFFCRLPRLEVFLTPNIGESMMHVLVCDRLRNISDFNVPRFGILITVYM